MKPGDHRIALLVDRKKRLTIFAEIHPPRLFVATQQMPGLDDVAPREHRPVSEDEAGGLVAGETTWVCLEVLGGVSYLIDSWCERRCLAPLGQILQGWPWNGLTDGAHELLSALQLARAAARDVATQFEWELLGAVESKLSSQLGAS